MLLSDAETSFEKTFHKAFPTEGYTRQIAHKNGYKRIGGQSRPEPILIMFCSQFSGPFGIKRVKHKV